MEAHNKTAEITKIALMVAINCISAYIIIPLPFSLSPVSLQTMIINLTGLILTPKQAFFALLAYILVGLAGIPVFTGGTAGPGKLFGPTGGYCFGFLVTVVLLAYLRRQEYNFKQYALLAVFISIPVIYLFGVLQLNLLTQIGWSKALLTGALPFIPLDIVKAVAAAYLAGPILRAFRSQ